MACSTSLYTAHWTLTGRVLSREVVPSNFFFASFAGCFPRFSFVFAEPAYLYMAPSDFPSPRVRLTLDNLRQSAEADPANRRIRWARNQINQRSLTTTYLPSLFFFGGDDVMPRSECHARCLRYQPSPPDHPQTATLSATPQTDQTCLPFAEASLTALFVWIGSKTAQPARYFCRVRRPRAHQCVISHRIGLPGLLTALLQTQVRLGKR